MARIYLDRGLRIVTESPLLPPHVVVARPGLNPAIAESVRTALTDTGTDADLAFSALGPGVGFGPVNDSTFELARRTVRAFEAARPLEMPRW